MTAGIRCRNQSRVRSVTISAQISRCYVSYITLDFGVVNLRYRNRRLTQKKSKNDWKLFLINFFQVILCLFLTIGHVTEYFNKFG